MAEQTDYYAKAAQSRGMPDLATMYATLALADAITEGTERVANELKMLRRELEQIRGAVGKL